NPVGFADYEYDGDGNLVFSEGEIEGDGALPAYYVRSTVLSQSLLKISICGQLDGYINREQLLNGQWRDITGRTLAIYAGGQAIATRNYDAILLENSDKITWQHRDPHNTIAEVGNASGSSLYSVDPLGTLVITARQGDMDDFWDAYGRTGDPNPPQGFY